MKIDGPTILFILIFTPFLAFIPWAICKAVVINHRAGHGRCPFCRAKFVRHDRVPVDQMYSSFVDRWTCPKGHVYTQGNRHFAEW